MVVQIFPRGLVVGACCQLAQAFFDGTQQRLELSVVKGTLQVVKNGVDVVLIVLDVEVFHAVEGVDGAEGSQNGLGQPANPLGRHQPRLDLGEFVGRVPCQESVGFLDQALGNETEKRL